MCENRRAGRRATLQGGSLHDVLLSKPAPKRRANAELKEV